ncbi:MAG: DUF5615 family PIN-like protein [Flavobacteriales bacterium]|nr:DUF5615 family PIN-like protein [Flavobacteriales bacterium]MBK6752188.1 DUF5615 family PIN-like protein [Flavobacteriales bacterium]MBK7269092.1 DUF5615 family PIN-like protein [Flavobacteriales bacterium]MBK7752352.1 DUF5615 family PIN-like protein [Flavobacteriales bacterium]MBK9075396.1 DUF5615 family PIN-like protein [Flavobacteriales bacterium]
MKGLLIDENLPLPTALPTSLPVTHSRQLGRQPSDTEIWDHALNNDLVIVTKDGDFVQRINMQGPPPRVVHLRVGNMRRSAFISWLYKQWPGIESASATHKLVNVYSDRMELVA